MTKLLVFDITKEDLDDIVDDHKMEDGITVCKQCHANIDDRYRRVKKIS